jgi:DNA repair exonuclease SbcCD ATPase subunit
LKLKNIKIHNFFTFEDVDIDLEDKTYFVTGENLDESSSDSNGSGKSLFCQSFMWCFFDDLLRKGTKKDDVIGKNDSYTSVVIELEIDKDIIVVERYRKHETFGSGSKVTVNGKDLTLHKDNDSQIQKVLGIDPKVIYHCAYTDKHKESIVSLTPTKLKEAVSEILQVDRFTKYIKESRVSLRDAENSLKTSEAEIRILSESISKTETLIEEANLDSEQKKIDAANEISSLEKDFEDFKSAHLIKIKYVMKEQESKRKEFKEISEEMASFEEDVKTVKSYEQRFAKGQTLIFQEKTTLSTTVKEIDSLTKILESKDTCTFCGGEINDEKVFQKHKEKLNKLTLSKTECESTIKKYEEQLQRMKEFLDESSEIISEYNEASSKTATIFSDIQAGSFQESSLRKDIVEQEDKVKDKIKNLNNTDDVFVEKMKARFKEDSEELEEKLKIHSIQKSAPENIKTLIETLNQIKTSMYNDFVYSFKNKINANLQEMTDGDFKCVLEDADGELQFSFTSPSKDGKLMAFTQFSDGEQARISKAVSLALEDMVNIGFIIDDENLSGVDDAGVKSILDFVLSKNQNKTFFFVGHQRAFKDYFVGYDNIHIIKEKGISRIVKKKL